MKAAAGFGLPFRLQVDFLRRKLDLPTERWDDIWQGAHDRAFVVAGATKADLLADLHAAVLKAAEQGTTLDEFRRDFDAIVARRGWTGWTGEGTAGGRAWRTRVIYQTNMATSHAAGRWAQINDPALASFRPYIKYHHADGVAHPRPLHLAWHGLVLPKDHPFWQTHAPPNGWGCHCWLTAAGERDYQAAKAAGKTAPPPGWDAIDARTGAPAGIDKGWAYAPGAAKDAPLRELVERKLLNLEAPIGAAMWQHLAPAMAAEEDAAFASFVDTVLQGPPASRLFVAGALKPQWIAAADRFGVAPATAEIIVRDHDIWHTFRASKVAPIDLAWYKQLPTHLRQPGAVILDTTHADEPAFLLVYSTANAHAAKLVVRLNYRIKKVGLGNIVETGKMVDPAGIRAQIGHGYEILEGGL